MLTEDMDLMSQSLPGVPIAEIAGDSRVLIENHSGVCKYTREMVCVNVRFGELKVCGKNLDLKRMTKEQLVISGKIESVSLVRRK